MSIERRDEEEEEKKAGSPRRIELVRMEGSSGRSSGNEAKLRDQGRGEM